MILYLLVDKKIDSYDVFAGVYAIAILALCKNEIILVITSLIIHKGITQEISKSDISINYSTEEPLVANESLPKTAEDKSDIPIIIEANMKEEVKNFDIKSNQKLKTEIKDDPTSPNNEPIIRTESNFN